MAEPPCAGRDLGRYRIDAPIGHGAMGVVYAATDRVLARRVALKVISARLADSATFRQRFAREAALLARLDSPHVVGIYDYGEHDGHPFLVTQYVAGGDLGALLHARGPMAPQSAAAVCAQIAGALSDTHRVGVVHRDVKPSNVLLRDPAESPLTAYLCDFGIAHSGADMPGPGDAVSGSWAFLAPEVCRGRPASPASDLYALGCVLWAALFGVPPYAGTDVEVGIAHGHAPVPQVAGHDAFARRLNRVLAGCLAKEPHQRYADAATLRADLEALAAIPTRAVRPAAGSGAAARVRGGRRQRSHRHRAPRRAPGGLVATLAAGVVAVAALVGLHPWEHGDATALESSVAAEASPGSPAAGARGVQGDLDGDGFGDVQARILDARGEHGSGAYVTTTWLSTGKRLQAPSVLSAPRDGTDLRVVRADFDGDGRPETLTCRIDVTAGCHATLSGGGRLTEHIALPVDVRRGLSALAGDVDGDGRADLVLAGYGSDRGPMQIEVAAGRGRSFAAPRRWAMLPSDRGSRPRLAIGDVTGDGRADLVCAVRRPGGAGGSLADLEVLSSNGRAFSVAGAARPLTGQHLDLVTVGDVTGDGVPEIVYAARDHGSAHLFVVTAGRGLGRPLPWGTVAMSRWTDPAFGLSDADGDGRADLVVAGQVSARAGEVDVGLSDGRSFASPTRWGGWPRRLRGAQPDLLGSAPDR